MGVGFTTGIPEYNEKGFHTSVNDVNCKYDDKSNEFGQITNADGHLFNYDNYGNIDTIQLGIWGVYATHPEHREDFSRALSDTLNSSRKWEVCPYLNDYELPIDTIIPPQEIKVKLPDGEEVDTDEQTNPWDTKRHPTGTRQMPRPPKPDIKPPIWFQILEAVLNLIDNYSK